MRRCFAVLSLVVLTAAAVFAATPASNHVVVVALENHSYSSVVGSPYMPYLNSLIQKGAVTSNYYANAGGSFPDYMMLTVGNEIATYAWWNGTVTQDNIVRALLHVGKTWKSYAESIPRVGYTGGTVYPYVKYHNPMAYFSDVIGSSAQLNNLVGLGQLSNDIASGQLPNFAYIVPNQEHNSHDCPDGTTNCSDSTKLSTTDYWLKTYIDPIIHSAQFQQDGILIIWWDEGSGGTEQVGQLIYGPNVAPGTKASSYYQHQSMLRTMAEALNLGDYPGASATAPAITGIWAGQSTTTTSSGSGVTITSPANGATVSSPFTVTATASGGSYSITGMYVYLDNVAVYHNSSNSVSASVTASTGTHTVLVKAWNSQGAIFSQSVSVTVGGSSGTTSSGGTGTTSSGSGVTISSPTNGSTVTSPFTVAATASGGSYAITGMYVYLDNVAVYHNSTNSVSTSVSASTGTHTVLVKAWNSQGTIFSQSVSVTVGSSSSTTTSTSTSGYVNITSPASGSSDSSPVLVSANSGGGAYPITGMWVYVDNVGVYNTAASSFSTNLSMSAGSHTILVKAWNSQGTIFKNQVSISVP